MSFSLKTAALAAAILVATAGGSFAATIDGNTKVLDAPNKWASIVQYAFDGEYVKVLKCQGKYCYVKISGPDGWVRKSDIDFGYIDPWPKKGPKGPVSACFWGPYGYVCIN